MAETILVIEDERLTRTNLINFLQSEGYDTLEASNGQVGIELAQAHLPDLIICDILMPELDGYDVLITLQQHMETAKIPFIFLTVSATEDGFRQGLALGADDYLSKPVTSEQLRTAITAQLRKTQTSLEALADPLVEAPPSEQDSILTTPIDTTSAVSIGERIVTSQKINLVTSTQAKLLETLCPELKQRLIDLRKEVEEVQKLIPNSQSAQRLRDDFAQLLSLVNEISIIQKSLTPENATDLLARFVSTINNVEGTNNG
ncbi:MAG: response regulator [Cyanobacteria bacterium P01_D01_bin.156]